MMTAITAEFLRETDACEEGVEWYRAHPEIHNAEWPVVCAALEEDGQEKWSLWVRLTVAEFGNAGDRAALRGDSDVDVRQAVAEFGTAEDRVVLRNDSDAAVRRTVAYYERSDPK